MKRTPLARSQKQLARTSRLSRSRMRRGKRKARPAHLRDDAYLAWCRRQRCASCDWPAPSHPHHPRHGVGKSQRAPDRDAFPLCETRPDLLRLGCHDAFHDRKQRFFGMGKEAAADWERAQTAKYQALYRAEGRAA